MVTAAGPWIILFAPLAAFIGIVLFGRKSKPVSAGLAIAGMVVSLLFTLKFFLHSLHAHAPIETAVSWVELPGLALEFGLLINPAAILMALVVTGVGLMIFLYSTGYMAEDPSYPRYFAYLSLFAFSMLGIVLANNFVTLFMFWELVGASSYLLIGYWYEKPAAAAAGKKAFLVNRIADFGFLIGILMIWNLSGMGSETARTLNFLQLEERLPEILHSGAVAPAGLAAIALLIFCGVLGKSAQFPLHVWLPDAMEGPTPVSALIHAATMVAAGVYLIGRVFFLFWASPEALAVIAGIGGFTALFAASLALVENDIKRVLAFSTLSQLGYMVMALGLGGYVAGTYHLTTHAFFKALLFLGAGSVIHALHTNKSEDSGEASSSRSHDIWQMGGLAKKMPATTFTFLAATLALAGIFPLSGFWSKDEILAVAFERNKLLWAVGTLSAAMTAFYMGRVFCVAFLGKPRSHHAEHAHESPPSMTVPLWILTVPTLIGGFIGIPHYLHHAAEGGLHVEFNLFVALISTLAAVGGLGLAVAVYARGARPGLKAQELLSRLAVPLSRKFWVDEAYAWINQNVQQRFADLLALFERLIIIRLCVNGVAKVTGLAGSLLRTAQTGKVQTYAAMLLAGLGFLLYFNLK